MPDYRLADLLNLSSIQKMADAHYRAAGMPIGILDADDGTILVGSGWQDICVKFHRVQPASLQRCRESDNYIKGRLVEGEACSYKCKNGLWDIGVPIIVFKRHLATLFIGQFFYEGEVPDRAFFIQQAREFGYDQDAYLNALDRVPLFSREKVDYILEYDKALARFIADLAEHALVKIEADEAIRTSERKFHAIFDHAYQFLGLLSTDGTLLEANNTALRFRGVKEQDVIGKLFWDTPWWIHSAELQERARLAVQKAAKGEFVRFEATHPDAEGGLHYIDFSLKPVTDNTGKVVLLIPEGRDITERKRAEDEKQKLKDELAQVQKMESVGRLAGGVAHDFNNMLTVILGNVELALKTAGPTHPLAPNLEGVRNAATRSADLTRQLLAFARKQPITPKVLDLNTAVDRMLEIVRRLVGEDIDLAWVPGRGLWQIRIDPAQIDQILMNLAANARDAITGNGKFRIATTNLTADEAYCAANPDVIPNEYVMLTVSDSGSGMDEKTLANIFEPFFTTKNVGKGTGLGLAMVYGIVKQNDGTITVRSELGKGTTFTMYFPRYETTSPVTAIPGAESATGGKETVLLVEDEPTLLELTRTILQILGYTVMTARTPGEAIRIAAERAGEIHLLITDVVMPEMNGFDLAKHLAALYPNLKPLFMSGYTANSIGEDGVVEEGLHFLQKPFTMNELAGKIRAALNHA